MSAWQFPERGVLFWPVGNGDSTTVVLNAETVLQFDIHHNGAFDADGDERAHVIDGLVERLPMGEKLPRLAVLAIGHHDDDHCDGYALIAQAVEIDELWVTLRSFIDDKNDDNSFTEPAQLVYEEAKRRRDEEIKAATNGKRAQPGDRLRIIGNGSVLKDEDWTGFPPELVTSAGQHIPVIDKDGTDHVDVVSIFVHTPFHSDNEEGDRNSTSLGVQLTLKNDTCEKRFLLLGDLKHREIEAFVEKSESNENEEYLAWDALLAPHHLSRNAVCRDEDGKWVPADAAEYFKRYVAEGAVVIASCRDYPTSEGDTDPPHREAEKVYVGIVGEDNFFMTADYAEGPKSTPVIISVTADECGHVGERQSTTAAKVVPSISKTTERRGDRTSGMGDKRYA